MSSMDSAIELPIEIVREVTSMVSPLSRDPLRAVVVLEALARSSKPLSRQRLSEHLGIPAAALARTITVLDERGFVTCTRRFGVGLGPRLMAYGSPFTSHFDTTVLRLVQPHLEMVASWFGASAFVEVRCGDVVCTPFETGDSRMPSTITAPFVFGHSTAHIGLRVQEGDAEHQLERLAALEAAAAQITSALGRKFPY
jgi:DNA-binding Lrp family transcriptional regulator